MIGRPGRGGLQMNGQPTAQNTRETGADGDLAGLPQLGQPGAHRASSPSCGTSTRSLIPHWAPPTHAMQIFRYAEQGSIELLWISATNPAVSLPDLARIRRILARDELFVVVQDIFLTETAELADVVLPGGDLGREDWARSRTPTAPSTSPRRPSTRPARRAADLDIFLDYARRMDFRDRDGAPLIKWHDPEARVRGVEGVLARPALRLQRHQLRPAARRQRHPVAVHRRRAGRHRAALRRRPLQHRPRLLRDVRPGPRRPAPRSPRRSTAPRSRTAARSCTPPTTSRPPRRPTTSIRSC